MEAPPTPASRLEEPAPFAVSPRLLLLAALLLPGMVAFLVGLPSVTDNFQGDDFRLIVENRERGPEFLIEAFGELLVAYYRPVSSLVFFAQQKAFDDNAEPWHLVTILIHSGVAVAISLTVWALTRSSAAALFTGLLFAIHPAYGAAVPWISTQTELVAALLSTLALALFVLSLRDGLKKPLYWGALVIFTAGLFAKEVGLAVLPAMVVYVLLQPAKTRRSWLTILLPFGMVSAVWGITQFYFRVLEDAPTLPFYNFDTHVWDTVRYYLLRLAAPLAFDEGGQFNSERYGIHSPFGWTVVVLQLAFFALAAARGSTAMRVLLVWLLAALAPISLWEPEFADSRYLYTASLPWCALAAASLFWLADILFRRPEPAFAGFALILLVLGVPYLDSTTNQNDVRIEEARHETEFVHQLRALDLEVSDETKFFLVNTRWGGFLNSSDFAARLIYGPDLEFETIFPGQERWARDDASPDDYFLGEEDGRLIVLPEVEVEVTCEGEPETVRVSNRSDTAIELETIGPLTDRTVVFALNQRLEPNQGVTFQLGPGASENVLSEELVFDETAQLDEGAEVQTSHGFFTDLCGSLDLYPPAET